MGDTEQIERLKLALDRNTLALDRVERVERMVLSTDPNNPGIALRLDRIEQLLSIVKWIGGGGLIGLTGTLILLWQITQALSIVEGV